MRDRSMLSHGRRFLVLLVPTTLPHFVVCLNGWRVVRIVFVRLCNQGDDRNAVDERGYTPLHDAADKGHTRVVSRLLQGEEVRFYSFLFPIMWRKMIAFPSSRRTKTHVHSCTTAPSFEGKTPWSQCGIVHAVITLRTSNVSMWTHFMDFRAVHI